VAGADCERIRLLKGVTVPTGKDGQRSFRVFDLQTHLDALKQAIQQTTDCRLVVIDPISAFMPKVDSHKNAEVRSVLAPLAELACRYQIAVVAVSHLNKAVGRSAMQRVIGSVAFSAVARSVWVVVKDANDPSRRLMLPAKNNLGQDSGGLAFRIVRDDEAPAVRLDWEPEPVTAGVDEVLQDSKTRPSPELDEAVEWLAEQLKTGPVAAKEIRARAKRDGLAWATVRRAKERLGVTSAKQGFDAGARWYWNLPRSKTAPCTSAGRCSSVLEDVHLSEHEHLRARSDQAAHSDTVDAGDAGRWSEPAQDAHVLKEEHLRKGDEHLRAGKSRDGDTLADEVAADDPAAAPPPAEAGSCPQALCGASAASLERSNRSAVEEHRPPQHQTHADSPRRHQSTDMGGVGKTPHGNER